jgi:flagellar motor protein MotB
MTNRRLEDPADEYQVWPAFVDLLAATSLLFVTLVAVFILFAHRVQQGVEEEARGLRTQRDSLITVLEGTDAYQRNVYSVAIESDSQFVRVILQADATFDQGRFVLHSLREEGKQALREIGQVLMDGGISPLYREVRVIGHTDAVPFHSGGFTNWELSAARAAVVSRFLVNDIGVNQCRISASGVASYYPVQTDTSRVPTAERLRKNRRIELEIIPARAAGQVERHGCDPVGDGTAWSG